MIHLLFLLLLPLYPFSSNAEGDALQSEIRIVSLSPNLTEILFEIGAGQQLVGTVDYSNYPEAAKQIPQVGSYNRINLEAVLALQPDLIVGWESGNAPSEIARLRELGFTVHLSEPRQLEDVATVMEQFGTLLGRSEQALQKSAAYRQRLQQLRDQYQQQQTVSVFYQVWNRPLLTINGEQIISRVIELCGGINIFADLDTLSPQLSIEAVLAENPQVIVASGMDKSRPEWLDEWKKYSLLQAVQRNNLYHVPPDILQRHGPRLIQGVEQLCHALQSARNNTRP